MTFVFKTRIYYEDTDAAGVVYYARYLHFLERARTEMLRTKGFNHQQIFAQHQCLFVVKNIKINYLFGAKIDDMLVVKTHIQNCKNASLLLEQNIWRQDKKLVESEVLLACVDSHFKVAKIPSTIKESLC